MWAACCTENVETGSHVRCKDPFAADGVNWYWRQKLMKKRKTWRTGKERARGKFYQWPAWKWRSLPDEHPSVSVLSHAASIPHNTFAYQFCVFHQDLLKFLIAWVCLWWLVVLYQGGYWTLAVLVFVMYSKSYWQGIGKWQRREGLWYGICTTLSMY